MPKPKTGAAGFMSYVRLDDESGRLSEFRERLERELRLQTGETFEIFQDCDDIKWGQRWRERISSGVGSATFFLPVITPSWFNSSFCRNECEAFLNVERALGRQDLILPLYYIETDLFSDEGQREQDQLARELFERQYADWRDLRWEALNTPSVGKRLEALAKQIRQVWKSIKASAAPAAFAVGAKTEVLSRPAADTAVKVGVELQQKTLYTVARVEPPTFVVDQMHRGNFTTIAEAVKAVPPGARIVVRPGLFRGGLVIDKPLEILGDGAREDIVIEAAGADTVLFVADLGRLANLTLRQTGGGQWYGVDIAQGRLELENCDITGMSLSCVAVRRGADPRVRRNLVHHGAQAGIFVYDNGKGTFEDNDVFANTYAGISVKTGGDPVVRRNRLHDNQSSGVYVYESGKGTFEENDIFGNVLSGVSVSEAGNPVLVRNRIHDGGQSGIYIYDGGRGTFEDNDVFGNTHANIAVKKDADPIMRRNRIHDSKQSGIYVYEAGRGMFEDNEIVGNQRAGIVVKEGGRPVVRRNRINRNGYEAVWVYEGGGGTFEDNDVRENARGPWDIAKDCEEQVTRLRNRES